MDNRLLLYRDISAQEPPKAIEVSLARVKESPAEGEERPRVIVALISSIIGLDSVTTFYPEFEGAPAYRMTKPSNQAKAPSKSASKAQPKQQTKAQAKAQQAKQQKAQQPPPPPPQRSTVPQSGTMAQGTYQPRTAPRQAPPVAAPPAYDDLEFHEERKRTMPFRVTLPPPQSQHQQPHQQQHQQQPLPHKKQSSPTTMNFDEFRFTPTETSPIVDLTVSPPRNKIRRTDDGHLDVARRLGSSSPAPSSQRSSFSPTFRGGSEMVTMRA